MNLTATSENSGGQFVRQPGERLFCTKLSKLFSDWCLPTVWSTDAMHRYNLGLKELDEEIGGIRSGANIMLIGPAMSGKNAVLNSIMFCGLQNGEAVVLVETRMPGEDALQKLKPPEPSFIGVVDCVARTLGVNARDTPRIRHVSSPVDLTGVGVRVSQLMEDFDKVNNGEARLCIDWSRPC